ncbi:Sua5/YciO/YrdC/YwlC family protein [Nitrosophilus labii]|uniref:Sua5/YciO/YrdC/YwlC family protein n=1 Tax=Nitrosophilus labii TaxID=2706014 RepID=UPI0018D73231|nr:Sua5/YciO/YrdC/YwlC family protein [Nitrosophilus labii]
MKGEGRSRNEEVRNKKREKRVLQPSTFNLQPDKIYLVQTETTVGFLSQNAKKLAKVKKRDPNKPFLISVDSFKTLKRFARVPKKYKKMVRRAQKTTFVYPNRKALRVIKDENHLRFLKKFGWMFSTSANESGKRFDYLFAYKNAEVIVEDNREFFEGKPSKLIKLGKNRVKKLR